MKNWKILLASGLGIFAGMVIYNVASDIVTSAK